MTQVWATMATVPERAGARAMAVESLLPQVDRLIVSFGHKAGDQVKFDCCENAGDVYIIGVDDDLVYPPDYVETTIRGIEHYGRAAVVGYHGFTINRDGGREDTYRCLAGLEERAYVDVIGTGVVGFHAGALDLSPADFPTRNAAMFWVALKAAQRGLPMVILPHPDRWFTYVEHRQTMWQSTADEDGSGMDYSQTMQPALEQLIALKDWPEEDEEEPAGDEDMVAA